MEAMDRAGKSTDQDANQVYSQLLAGMTVYDGLPKTVADKIWETALRVCPAPKRGPNLAAKREYDKRAAEWKTRTLEKIEKAKQKVAAKMMARKAIAAYTQVPPKVADLMDDLRGASIEIVDDWESLAEISLKESMDTSKMVRDLRLETPEPIVASMPHGHPVLAKSRAFADTYLRRRGLSTMLIAAERDNSARPVVFDVGAGASGVKRAYKAMTTIEGGRSVYWHATFPICSDDLERDHLLLGQTLNSVPLINSVNWIERTGVPMKDVVNVCRHRASECNCLSLYTDKFVMSIHSSYYFGEADWANLMRWTDVVYSASHIPSELDREYPSESPEFVWRRASSCEELSWVQRTRAKIREWATGRPQVAFVPLKDHGTVYVHDDPRPDHARGGFHVVKPLGKTVDWLTRTDPGLAILAGTMVGAAASLVAGAASVCVRPSLASRFVLLGAILQLPLMTVRAQERARVAVYPGPWVNHTVQVVNGRSLMLKGEPLATMVSYKRVPPAELRPRVVACVEPREPLARELAAMLATTTRPDKAQAVAIARCLRENCSPVLTSATITRASTILTESGNRQAPRTESRSPLVIVERLCASGATICLTAATLGLTCTLMLPSVSQGWAKTRLIVTAATCRAQSIPWSLPSTVLRTLATVGQACWAGLSRMGRSWPLV